LIVEGSLKLFFCTPAMYCYLSPFPLQVPYRLAVPPLMGEGWEAPFQRAFRCNPDCEVTRQQILPAFMMKLLLKLKGGHLKFRFMEWTSFYAFNFMGYFIFTQLPIEHCFHQRILMMLWFIELSRVR